MGFFSKMCSKMGLGEPEEEYYEEDSTERVKEDRTLKEKDFEHGEGHLSMGNVVDFGSIVSARAQGSAVKLKVVVIEPKSFDDAQQVANCLRDKRPVVMNFDKTDGEVAKRIIDFISGTTYALNGEIKKVGRNVFLCAPNNVNVSINEEEKKINSEMPWVKK